MRASSVWLLLFAFPYATAAEQMSRSLIGDTRFWVVAAAVQVLGVIGYLASSLAQWAKWPDGTLIERLALVQGSVTALLAANIAFYGGYYYVECPEIVAFIAAAVASWGGDKFISPILVRITGRIQDSPNFPLK